MSAWFITGAGTDIGKTFVACGLIAALRRRGDAVSALKPVVSGIDDTNAAASDPGRLLAALGQPATAAAIARLAPWRFGAPLSPDMAARREGRSIDFTALVDLCRNAIAATPGVLLIEGVGGVMVPLDDGHTVTDWLAALRLPALLVIGSYLGAISHGLSALDTLRWRKIVVPAIVVNESHASTVPLDETAATVARFAGPVPILCLPRLRAGEAHEIFDRLADLLHGGGISHPSHA